jgi:pimeloyl-ACP methyl ester carboxylesterase
MVGPDALPEGVRLARHCLSLVPASTYRRALEALTAFDRRADLPRIAVPTLVIAGEHDPNAPPGVMKKMADAIPRSTFMEMRGVGHLQNLEAPDDFDGLLLNFLALPRELLH